DQPLDDPALARIGDLPGVVVAYPELSLERVTLEIDGASFDVSATGLPPQAAGLRFVRDSLVAGRFLNVKNQYEAVLGRRLASRLAADDAIALVGRHVELSVKGLVAVAHGNYEVKDRRVRLEVVGVWDPPSGPHGFSSDGLIVPQALMLELPGARTGSAWS